MPRYALRIEYDGTGFVGWQRQDNGPSVQALLEQAASKLAHGQDVTSVVAGRTDAGVHAEGQVAHIDLPGGLAPEVVRDALNFHMKPQPVVVLAAALVDAEWSARFSAIGRCYRYCILNRRPRPALALGRAWHVERRLDEHAMDAAAQTLLGRHDFTSFRAAACQAKSPLRTLDRLDVRREGDCVLVLAEARSFLHHQVRNMVGTLKLVGDGRWSVDAVRQALVACDRGAAGPTAPAEGLYLTAVRYKLDPFAAAWQRG
jgi:tRNA pseudouridine38-40 synthase